MRTVGENRPDPVSAAYDVVIVGGGLTGSSLATALADGRRRILVLEARKGKNPRFNGELIHPSGVDQLEALGFLGDLHAAGGVDVVGFAIVDNRGARHDEAPTTLPYAEIPGSRDRGFAIDHHDLVDVLRRHAQAKPGVEYRFGERVTELVYDEERVVGVKTASGELRAGLVLAADGRHSKVRALVEMPERARLISYTAAARLPDCNLPAPNHGHIFLGAPGPILAYPISATDARTCIDLPADMDRGKEAVRRAIEEQYLPVLPAVVRPSFDRALAEQDLELAANYAIYTDECIVPGLALVGDACGCSHPLTATGMTIALNDVKELAAALRGVSTHDRAQLDGALETYQKARYRFVRAREILADALYEVFLGAEDGTRAIREGIFRYWNTDVTCRARSMALLSGHDSRLESFVREYVKVVAMSTSTALRGRVNEPSLRGRVSSLVGLGRKTIEKVAIAARSVREGYLA